MKKIVLLIMVVVVFLSVANIVSADTFGTGANQFTIDFVEISGDASSANGTNIGYDGTFNDPSNDYRMGTYEITNAQWGKFVNVYGTLTGSPSSAYDESSLWAGTNVPTNELSWYEAAQFTNWLNTSSGYNQAYKFTGTQGQSDYTFVSWNDGDTGYDASNPYRNSEAFYFLPTVDEWIKAAYWNGTALQSYANASAGDIVSGSPDPAKWNYAPSVGSEPWDVGTGSEELNGTFDMMGNIWELMESSYFSGDYTDDSIRCIMGGSYVNNDYTLISSYSHNHHTDDESFDVGFRVASVPEPATLFLFGLGGLSLIKRKRR